jgi:hypothetical protein
VRHQAVEWKGAGAHQLEEQCVDAALRPAVAVMVVVRRDHGESTGHHVRGQALLRRIARVAEQHQLAVQSDEAERLREHRRAATGVHHDVEARLAGGGEQRMTLLLEPPVHAVRGPAGRGMRQSQLRQVGHDDARHAGRMRPAQRHLADRTGADDQYAAAQREGCDMRGTEGRLGKAAPAGLAGIDVRRHRRALRRRQRPVRGVRHAHEDAIPGTELRDSGADRLDRRYRLHAGLALRKGEARGKMRAGGVARLQDGRLRADAHEAEVGTYAHFVRRRRTQLEGLERHASLLRKNDSLWHAGAGAHFPGGGAAAPLDHHSVPETPRRN